MHILILLTLYTQFLALTKSQNKLLFLLFIDFHSVISCTVLFQFKAQDCFKRSVSDSISFFTLGSG